MADITFSAGMDSDGMEKAYQRMIRENGKLREELTKLATQSREAADKDREYKRMQIDSIKRLKTEQEGLAAAAGKIMEAVKTPFERYKANAEELRSHLQAGRLGQEDYRKALALLARDFKAAERNTDEFREAQKAATKQQAEQAATLKQAAAIMESVLTPLEKLKREEAALNTHLEKGTIDAETHRRALAALSKEMQNLENNTEEARQKQAAENAMLREAAQVIEKTQTKQERYALAIERLNKLRRSGKIDAETHARATKAETEALDEGKATSFSQKMGEVAAGVLSANLAMAAGSKAVQVLREEYERLIERQSKMAGAQISLAGAQENALQNLDTTMSPKDFLDRMRKESQNLGMSEKDLTNAAANALSAKGDKTAAEAVDATVAAAKFKRFGSAEEKAGLAGTALDLGKAFQMTPEQSLGFLAQAQGPSRVVSAQGMSDNIAPAIVGAAQFGVSKEVAASIAAALSSTSSDKTGAKTQTTMSALLEQLRSFGGEGSNVEDTLRLIQSDKNTRTEFLQGASFEKQMIGAVEGLLTAGTQTEKEFQNAQKVFGEMSPQQAFDRQLAMKNESEAIRLATMDQKMGNAAEQVQLSDPAGAQSGIIRDRMKELRDSLGNSGLGTRITGVLEDLDSGGTQSIDTAIQSLNEERNTVGQGMLSRVTGMMGGATSAMAVPRDQLTEAQKKQVDQLTLLIDQMKELNALTKAAADNKQAQAQAGAAVGRRMNQGEAGP